MALKISLKIDKKCNSVKLKISVNNDRFLRLGIVT